MNAYHLNILIQKDILTTLHSFIKDALFVISIDSLIGPCIGNNHVYETSYVIQIYFMIYDTKSLTGVIVLDIIIM